MNLIIKGLIGLAIIGGVTTTVVLLPENGKVEVRQPVLEPVIETQTQTTEIKEPEPEPMSEPVKEEPKTTNQIVTTSPSPETSQPVVLPVADIATELKVVQDKVEKIEETIQEEQAEQEIEDQTNAVCEAANKEHYEAIKAVTDYMAETERMSQVFFNTRGQSSLQAGRSSSNLANERLPGLRALEATKDSLMLKALEACS